MSKQPALFDDPRYAPFGSFPDSYPKGAFKPLHPAFIRKGRVHTEGLRPREFTVDLSIGECDCQKGTAWSYDQKNAKWYNTAYCGHKLRMMAGIVSKSDNVSREDITRAYIKAVGTRYNPFNLVSAFHKELRRGDFEAAWLYGVILSSKRSIRGVFDYLLNILYEETRDHEMGEWLLATRIDRRKHTMENMAKAISWFCASIKKWQIPRRMAVFESEMNGYRLLAKDYGYDVAKGENIIPAAAKPKLLKFLIDGAHERDHVKFQRGLKGLLKLKITTADRVTDEQRYDHRYFIYEQLYELAEKLCPDPDHAAWVVINYVNNRIKADIGIGYHELNAIGDAITGEPATSGLLSPVKRDIATRRPYPGVPLGKWPLLPLYSFDNHTYAGKSLMRRFPDQLKAGAVQKDLDFRWCGAYFGVAYRMLAFKQYGEISEWHNVDWPKWLFTHVDKLWY